MPTTTCAWKLHWSLERQHEGEYLEHHGRPVLEAFFTHTYGEGSPVADQDDTMVGDGSQLPTHVPPLAKGSPVEIICCTALR